MPFTAHTPDVVDPQAGKITPTAFVPDAGNGDMFPAGDKTLLRVANTNAATRTVTVQVPNKPGGFTIASLTYVIPATTGVAYIGPFPASTFGQQSGADTGNVYVTISASAGVTYELVRMP